MHVLEALALRESGVAHDEHVQVPADAVLALRDVGHRAEPRLGLWNFRK